MNTKRLFDILFSLFALMIAGPIILIAAIAIKLESKGPAFYTSFRVGQHYKIFKLLKLRSMAQNADAQLKSIAHLNQYDTKQEETNHCEACAASSEPCSPLLYMDGEEICENLYLKKKRAKVETPFNKFQNDPRVTKVGAFIRKTSIDELPQLINILKGDMSLVGNRPLPLGEAELLTRDDAATRFMAPAGLTGLWQVTKRGQKGEMSANERIQLDNTYAKKFSLLYDFKLIMKTFPALLQDETV